MNKVELLRIHEILTKCSVFDSTHFEPLFLLREHNILIKGITVIFEFNYIQFVTYGT